MRHFIILALLLAACGGSTEPPQQQQQTETKQKAVDPAMRIHVLNRLDTASAMGRGVWNVFVLIYSPDQNQAGVAYTGGPDPMGGSCIAFSSDSIGQRQVIVLALADTVHPTSQATAASIANAWFSGTHTIPAGWAVLPSDSLDWGVSAQFDAGHGRTSSDPIRWSLTWTSPATVTRAEAPNDLTCT